MAGSPANLSWHRGTSRTHHCHVASHQRTYPAVRRATALHASGAQEAFSQIPPSFGMNQLLRVITLRCRIWQPPRRGLQQAGTHFIGPIERCNCVTPASGSAPRPALVVAVAIAECWPLETERGDREPGNQDMALCAQRGHVRVPSIFFSGVNRQRELDEFACQRGLSDHSDPGGVITRAPVVTSDMVSWRTAHNVPSALLRLIGIDPQPYAHQPLGLWPSIRGFINASSQGVPRAVYHVGEEAGKWQSPPAPPESETPSSAPPTDRGAQSSASTAPSTGDPERPNRPRELQPEDIPDV